MFSRWLFDSVNVPEKTCCCYRESPEVADFSHMPPVAGYDADAEAITDMLLMIEIR